MRVVRVVAVLTVAIFASGVSASTVAADPATAADTEQALTAFGFREPRLFYSFDDGTKTVVVRHVPTVTTSGRDAAGAIASIVWHTEELRFDEVVVTSPSDRETTFGYEQLAASLGPRAAGFDQRPLVPWGTNVPVLGLHGDRDRDSRDLIASFRLWAIVAVVMAAAIWLVVLWLAVSPVGEASGSRLFS